MKEPIISVSGLRGVIGESLSPELAARFACAYAAGQPAGPIVLGRDGRTTGRMLCDAVRSGLCAVGRDVVDADVAATPTIGVMVRETQAAGGIQVSASHNPPEYNGIKLFDDAGKVLTATAGAQVIQRYRSMDQWWCSYDQIGHVEPAEDPHAAHLALVLQTVDVEAIRARRFKVLLDSNHGAGGRLGTRLLEALGCEAVCLGNQPTGRFAHTPEPTAENLAGVLQQVTAAQAVVGFCQDPDADRLALIDETGRYVGEEYTLAVCLDHILQRLSGPVVINCATSMMSEDLAKKYGVPLLRSAVGEANVVEMMQQHEAVFGGEGNGGPIDPRVGYVRDSFVGMALVLDLLATAGGKLSEIVDALPGYAIRKTKAVVPSDRILPVLDQLQSSFPQAEASRLDGLRLAWPGKWLLVRASNTEPIVRAIAEAATAEEAEGLCDEALAAIEQAV